MVIANLLINYYQGISHAIDLTWNFNSVTTVPINYTAKKSGLKGKAHVYCC